METGECELQRLEVSDQEIGEGISGLLEQDKGEQSRKRRTRQSIGFIERPGNHTESAESSSRKSVLKCFYTNADSLLNKMQELRLRINDMETRPEIIVITEVMPKNYRFKVTLAEISLSGWLSALYLWNKRGREPRQPYSHQ